MVGGGRRGQKCFPRTWHTWKDVAEHLPCGEGMGSGGEGTRPCFPSLCTHTGFLPTLL